MSGFNFAGTNRKSPIEDKMNLLLDLHSEVIPLSIWFISPSKRLLAAENSVSPVKACNSVVSVPDNSLFKMYKLAKSFDLQESESQILRKANILSSSAHLVS